MLTYLSYGTMIDRSIMIGLFSIYGHYSLALPGWIIATK